MTFLHGSLVAIGSFTVAVPIVLHLIMRQRPRHAVFPALRFVTASLIQNQRKLQLRQWALLTLRCFAVAAAAVALARPLLSAGAAGSTWLFGGSFAIWALLAGIAMLVWWRGTSPGLATGFIAIVAISSLGLIAIVVSALVGGSQWVPIDQEEPVAAVFVLDDSPRMEYRDRNDTRLQDAQTAALTLLRQLPPGSDIAILAAAAESTSFTVDAASAAAAIRGTKISLRSRLLPDAMATARSMLADDARTRREIFVFSDLTRVGWLGYDAASEQNTREDPAAEDATVADGPDTTTYLVDVGVPDAQNVRLGLPNVPGDSTATEAITITVDVAMYGDGGVRNLEVELWLEEPATERPVVIDGQPQRPRDMLKDRQRAALSVAETSRLQFKLTGLDEGIRHGRIRINAADSLAIDDERYFTVAIRPPERILLAAGPRASTHFLAEALAPQEIRLSGRARYECEQILTDDLVDYALDSFSALMLVDPPPLQSVLWQKIEAYVQRGGGLAMILGRNVHPIDEFNSPAAMAVLPGRLAREFKSGGQSMYITLPAADHPVLQPLKAFATSVPLDQSPVYRHWVLEDVSPSAVTVLEFRNRRPALLESRRGQGTILTWTTPLSDELNVEGRPPWNLLPTGPTPWPFVMLADQMAAYLVGRDRTDGNFTIGQSPGLPVAEVADGSRVQVFTPGGTWETIISKDGMVSLGRLSEIGIFRIALSDGELPTTGFSANLPAEATDLTRLSDQELDKLLGKDRYHLLRDQDDLTREVSASRIGQEGYPWSILALALLLAAEHVLGNRFYSQ